MIKVLDLKLLIGIFALLVVAVVLTPVSEVEAASLRVNPLMYKESLKPGEVKKGFIEVSNPSGSSVIVQFNVKGFKQVDGEGNLEYFPSESLSKGILLDLKEVELGPREALRLYFLVDGTKLPQGDVFAVIFASSKPDKASGISPSAEVGTLLIIENGEGGPREAAVSSFKVPFLNFGSSVNGRVGIRNTTSPTVATGFFPTLKVSLGPIFQQSQSFEGPLVSAGITRTVSFSLPTDRLGFYKIEAEAGGDTRSKWIFIATGYWKWVLFSVFVSLVILIVLIKRMRRKKPFYHRK